MWRLAKIDALKKFYPEGDDKGKGKGKNKNKSSKSAGAEGSGGSGGSGGAGGAGGSGGSGGAGGSGGRSRDDKGEKKKRVRLRVHRCVSLARLEELVPAPQALTSRHPNPPPPLRVHRAFSREMYPGKFSAGGPL